ncbi:MAG: arginine deiminase-related protein [Planctomycetota bacterium]
MTDVARAVLMVPPTGFDFNPETADSNAFMHRPNVDVATLRSTVRSEFDGVVDTLTSAGIRVIVLDDDPNDPPPDAVFPNNWFSTHADGTIVLYPMESRQRRRERRRDALVRALTDAGCRITSIHDLSPLEREGLFLEGTGSLVIDHANGTAFAARSSRMHDAALDAFRELRGIDVVAFDAVDARGVPIYHTNVMMSIGPSCAVVALDQIVDAQDRHRVASTIEASGHEIVAITATQMQEFAGNVLTLRADDGSDRLVLSQRALDSLRTDQIARLKAHATPLVVDVTTIEHIAGGGVRCMLAEVFLPVDPPATMPS